MGRIIIAAIIVLLVSIHSADAATNLYWTPPTTNTDGSALTNLAGYKVYWGTSSGNYTNSLTIPVCSACPAPTGAERDEACLPLPPGTYYIAVTAFNTEGGESGYSNEETKTIPPTTGTLGNIDTVSPGSATRVDGFDLMYLLKCFGKGITGLSCSQANFTLWQNSCDKADLNYSGDIDGTDFGILNTNFGL